jgi:hypothetical protein
MYLLEPIEVINKRLADFYGKGDNGQQRLRVVYSDDQIEKQYTNFTPEGLELPYKIMREVPKYKQWIQHKYILESLTAVPETSQDEVNGLKLSYEPLWVFQSESGEALPPKWEIIQVIMQSVEEAMSRPKGYQKYKMDEKQGNTAEALQYRENKLMEAMYGNESSVGDALATGNAVGYGTSEKFDFGKKIH